MKKEKDQFIFGIHAVTEALDAGRELEKVLLKGSRGTTSDLFIELRNRLIAEKIPFQHVPVEKLNTITMKNHQGVIAYISEIAYSEIEFILPRIFEQGKNPFILVLDQVSDVRNFGAIARTAECAGVDAIVLPYKGSARITAEAVKTSAGALHSIPVCRHPDLRMLLDYLRSSGLQVFAATEKSGQTLYKADLSVPAVILMGAEDAGISPQLFEYIDHSISIPQYGTIGSLNVSVAAGIIMYEAVRQRNG
ncbi:MAG: 23S rRNA (guanosine(2251)-2'-O)-methyltransferase RlmB [Bacteroidales bacterium]|nr:23S rRNA (guanosine(2251)-2'-O)-methyltransferase RlmB [Bacteroidales bacterium]